MLISCRQYAYLIIASTIIFPIYVYAYNPLITPSRLLVLFLPLILATSFSSIAKLHAENKFLFLTFFVYFVFRFLSALVTDDIILGLGFVFFDFCQFYLCFILGGILVIKGKVFKSNIITFSIILVVGFSIVEYFFEDNVLRLLATGDSDSSISASTLSFRDGIYRSQGTFEHPLSLAHFLILSLIYYLIKWPRAHVKSILFISILLLATLTTDSSLGLGCLISLFVFYYFKRPNKYSIGLRLLFFLKISVISFIGIMAISEGYKTSEESTKSTETRIKQAAVGFNLLNENFIFGVGPYKVADKLQAHSESLSTSDYLWKSTVDSLVLIRFLESGVVAGFCFLVIIFNVGIKLFISSFTRCTNLKYCEFLGGVSVSFFIFSPLYTVNAFAFIILGYMYFNIKKEI